MNINPYLNFNGTCEEALKFYEKTLGAKIEMMMPHEGTPMANEVPPEWKKKIMHASFTIDGHRLMASDFPGEHPKAEGFSLAIGLNDVAKAEKIFTELSEGGKVVMPLEETFWAKRFGMLVDRYGIPWMVNCEQAGATA